MNNDRALPAPPGQELGAFLGAPQAGSRSSGEESPFLIFQKVHRLLRGRYPAALSLAALGAIAGAAGGWFSTTPKYMSQGSIRVAPVLPTVYNDPTGSKGMPPMFISYVKTQANLLSEPRVVDMALHSSEWRPFVKNSDPRARDKFVGSLAVVTALEEPEWIRVRFLDPSPKAAKVAVEQIIDSYINIWGPTQDIYTPEMIDSLKGSRRRIQQDIDDKQAEIERRTLSFGTRDLSQLQTAFTNDLLLLNRQLEEIEFSIKQAEAPLASGQTERPTTDPELLNAEIAKLDPQMTRLLAVRDEERMKFGRMEGQYTEAYRPYKVAKLAAEAADREATRYRETWLRTHNNMIPGVGIMPGTVTKEGLASMKLSRDNLQAQRDLMQEKCNKLAAAKSAVDQGMAEIKRRQEDLNAIEARLQAIDIERLPTDKQGSAGRIQIISRGDEPTTPYKDPRLKLGVLGLVFGAGLPIGLFMLVGLMDKRYRYSDDASAAPGHVALLGILPYLPENMADPEQAAVAAHCVHQIRTLLQIGGTHHSRKVFTVTSPTSGDGKTSLALSLGLSFAASGSRTLLIDFDMVGGGLTSAMQARGEVGLLDAINRGELNGHVKATAFNRLSLVPAGENDAHEVSRLSPLLVRRILDQAREKFDVIVIDTGPILGSLEASLVAAESDGVILALGRGQQRFQVERAINHLAGVGARLVGLVFNRANPGDFRRAVSSASVRSVPVQGNGHTPGMRPMPALGPMASTVASHIRGDAVDDL